MQTQEVDIIGVMLGAVRDTLGLSVFTPETEKAIEAKLRMRWGGQEVYVKKSDVDVHARARAIRTRYNMCNRRELQDEFGISRAQFYKILKGD